MLPEGVHNRESDVSYMVLNRHARRLNEHISLVVAATSSISSTSADAENPDDYLFMYGVNVIRTKYDSTVRRGAIVKAIAVFSPYRFVDCLRDLLDKTLQVYLENPDAAVLETLLKNVNKCDIGQLPTPSYLELSMLRRSIYGELHTMVAGKSSNVDLHHHRLTVKNTGNDDDVTGDDGKIDTVLNVPLYRTLDEFGEISLSKLVLTFGEAVMRIYHGVLTGQRVLFVGYNHSAQDVSQMVMSAVAMVAPPMSNVIRRAYPYACLTDLGFLEVQC
jgi:hypothetical protein